MFKVFFWKLHPAGGK